MLERFGARIDLVPLIEEVLPEDRTELHEFIRRLVALETDFVVFPTGVGVRFVFGEAAVLGMQKEFAESLGRLRIVARGSKTVAALNREEIPIEHIVEDPTSAGIIEYFSVRVSDHPGREDAATPPVPGGEKALRILLQLYGTPNPSLVRKLETSGMSVFAAQAYVYREVSDRGAIEKFIQRILSDQVQLLAITSAPQVRILFEHVARIGKSAEFTAVLNSKVIVAAIGKVAIDALAEYGVTAHIVPDSPKLGPFATSIADFFSVVAR